MRFGILLFCVFFLFSCSGDDSQLSTKKTDFYVKLLPTASEASKTEFVEKSSRITAGSTLMLASDGIGQVSLLNVKEGDFVKK
jgi:multidrug efflux pump subunit AcrA (membrane-fusion protein)